MSATRWSHLITVLVLTSYSLHGVVLTKTETVLDGLKFSKCLLWILEFSPPLCPCFFSSPLVSFPLHYYLFCSRLASSLLSQFSLHYPNFLLFYLCIIPSLLLPFAPSIQNSYGFQQHCSCQAPSCEVYILIGMEIFSLLFFTHAACNRYFQSWRFPMTYGSIVGLPQMNYTSVALQWFASPSSTLQTLGQNSGIVFTGCYMISVDNHCSE